MSDIFKWNLNVQIVTQSVGNKFTELPTDSQQKGRATN